MSEKIYEQIKKSRYCSLSELMGSLSLDMLGISESKNLVEYGINTLDKWVNLTEQQIMSFPGYQKTKACRISQSVCGNKNMILRLASDLVITEFKSGNKLNGVSFCFTGAMRNSRKTLENIVLNAGGQIRAVSKELNYLVIADANSMSSKAVKARKLGISLLSEIDFLKILE